MRTPLSVITMNSCADWLAHQSMMADVEPMKSAMRSTSCGHSGCAATSASGMFRAGGNNTSGGERCVYDAGSLPDFHVLAAGLLLHIVAEIDVRQKQDRLAPLESNSQPSTALRDVQRISLSAFTSTEVLM